MNKPCVKCGEELSERNICYDTFAQTAFTTFVCNKKSCPAYSFLQAGLEPITKEEK